MGTPFYIIRKEDTAFKNVNFNFYAKNLNKNTNKKIEPEKLILKFIWKN